jgi:hypothetical protein
MPQFLITAPDGTKYNVTGPEGSTEQEALAQVQAQHVQSGLHLNPSIAPQVPQGAPRPFAPGEYVDNPNGSWSSEISMTVTHPDLNGGKPTVIPSMWLNNGQPVRARNEDQAVKYAVQSGLKFNSFDTIDQADAFANDREAQWQKVGREGAAQLPPLYSGQSNGANTAAYSNALGLPPIPADVQKNAAINALSADNGRPLSVGNVARDIGQGTLGTGASIAGIPGNIEALGRMGLNAVGIPVSRQTSLMTSDQIGNSLGGADPEDVKARNFGNLLGPLAMTRGVPMLAKGAGALVRGLATNTLGVTTGAGSKAIDAAYEAGKTGGSAGQAFLDNMRGDVPISDVVDSAKDAVAQLGRDRSVAYQSGIASTIKGDPAILDMQPIHDAVAKSLEVGKFKGVTTSESAQKVRDAVMNVLTDWQSLDPAEYHTAEGLDALKQKIGDLAYEGNIADAVKPGSPGAKVLGGAYNAIKSQITAQAPGYSDVMRDYSQATDELRNIQSALSLNPKANVDTSLRKLQSIMRNNVSTNYGARTQMASRLTGAGGAADLIPALAGQALSSATPRGIATMGDIGAIGGAALAGHPAALAAIPATSPRLVGEGAYALGALGRGAKSLLPNAGQVPAAINNAGVSLPALMSNPVIRALLLQRALTAAQSANSQP